jgi:thiamine-monophosphate kinase
MADEFSLIETWFAPLSREIGDDCALLELEPGQRLAISVDTQVEAVHFLPGTEPGQIAYRAAVTALSDLAAMGATPRAMTLALTLSNASDDWVQAFAGGIREVLQEYQLELLGGDTTRGPLTVTIQVMGTLPLEQALTRAGAQPGDGVYVSGCTGDAAAALAQLKGEWHGDDSYADYLLQRFYRPTAQVVLGRNLLTVASSAIDVSDGLLADAAHLCRSSGVGMRIDAGKLPLSMALQSMANPEQALHWALSGGDDYELLFTVPPDRAGMLPAGCTHIGEVVVGSEVECNVKTEQQGYRHFSSLDAGESR